MYRMKKIKFKKVAIDPTLQVISTVGKKGDKWVDKKYVEQVSELVKILEGAGLKVSGDGIHRLEIHMNGLCIGYQLVVTYPVKTFP